MSTETQVSPHHAAQLARCRGALKELQPELFGGEYAVVGSTRKLLHERAEAIDHDVEPAEFAGVGEPELRSISTFCDSLTDRYSGDDEQRLAATARIARDRLQEVRDA